MSNKLKLWFDKNINDIKGCLPNGEKGRWDIYLLFNAFLGIKILDDNNLITELKNRGYDISTIKFEITKKNSEIQSVTTKDLTLDMWDKSIVNKIKRLEKSIELNNKVKKDLKKQIDQLKQQLAEKQNTIDEINKEFVQAVHDWKVLCAEKDKEIERLKERLSVFDNFKDNYGYTNYDDSEILEDLQSRAFQAEDDTRVVNELLQFFNIFDENELVDKVKEPQTQLAIQMLEEVKEWLNEPFDKDGCFKNGGDLIDYIDQQISNLRG